MERYSSFSEKARFFNHKVTNDIHELVDLLKTFAPQKRINKFTGEELELRYFFRGVSNASFKIYSSLQRCFFERIKNGQKISLQELSEEIMERFTNNDILLRTFSNEVPHPSNKSDLAKWAFIQHFGGPSHFIDFTPDLNTALFFATFNTPTNKSDKVLENYISLYICLDNPSKYGNLNSVYESSSSNGRKVVVESKINHPDLMIDTKAVDSQMQRQPLDPLFWGSSIYGETMFSITIPGSGEIEDFSINNSHISMQKGNFFLGNIIDPLPLECAKTLYNDQWDVFGNKYYTPGIICIDINKSLIPELHRNFHIPKKEDVYTPDDFIPDAKSELSALWKPKN